MDRKNFLKKSIFGAAGLGLGTKALNAKTENKEKNEEGGRRAKRAENLFRVFSCKRICPRTGKVNRKRGRSAPGPPPHEQEK